ncbi:MAG: radical SAM protein [Candidatus Promineifilaceae bacterium]|nr:radical SAM protein [Candidatus Promineifilaceae bacterium]
MELTGLHILLTYICNYECDHCFVWGSPNQTGTLTLAQLDNVLRQAKQVGTVSEVYFEGGEAFLFYPILVEAVRDAKKLGFRVGLVSNGYWATGVEDAWHWLQPLVAAGLDRLELSLDTYHRTATNGTAVHPAVAAAEELFLSVDAIVVEPPRGRRSLDETLGERLSGGGVMFRGRAAARLTEGLPRQPWSILSHCPYEDLAHPRRIHLDPLGNLHLCQGIVIGNLFVRPLKLILAEYDPAHHPIAGPLVRGGPSALVENYNLAHERDYVDACHLCYTARVQLRSRFPQELGPDQMYGIAGGSASVG